MHAMIVHFPNQIYVIGDSQMEMEAVIYSRSNSILIFYLNKYGFTIILLDKKKSVVLFSFDMVHLLAYQIEKKSLSSLGREVKQHIIV